MVMGMRITVSFKGTDGIRGTGHGNFIGRIISRAWEAAGTTEIARARTMPKQVCRNRFGDRVTG
jgi:hypothetical protein